MTRHVRFGSSADGALASRAPDGVGSLLCIRSPRLQSNWGILHNIDSDQATLTSIFFAAICASGVFGSVTVTTPFLKHA